MLVRKYSASDFPLASKDRAGETLKPGDLVRVCAVPDSTFHGFTPHSASRYCALKGRILPVSEFDEAGYAVISMYYTSPSDLTGQPSAPAEAVSYEAYDFCFDARDLQHVL